VRTATYVGIRARLKGKTCLIQDVEGVPGGCKVQFDDLRLKEAFGWWHFRKRDFEEGR
jgi:hypothetical protein